MMRKRIQAVGFTGSRRVGRILVGLGAAREAPIPVFAEMSSLNPVFLLPGALTRRAEAMATGLIDSMTLGTGQFCTKPGLVVALAGSGFDRFCNAARIAIAARPATTMLNAGIHRAYEERIASRRSEVNLETIAQGVPGDACAGQPRLFKTAARHFLGSPHLLEEVFGPASLLVECGDLDELCAVAHHLDGQLTATLHLEDSDTVFARGLLRILERKAGRILTNGFPTGVEVGYAMVHGGPAPATSNSSVTSVGALAIERFLRPVCYQDLPAALLPESLQDANPLHLWRLVDGKVLRDELAQPS